MLFLVFISIPIFYHKWKDKKTHIAAYFFFFGSFLVFIFPLLRSFEKNDVTHFGKAACIAKEAK